MDETSFKHFRDKYKCMLKIGMASLGIHLFSMFNLFKYLVNNNDAIALVKHFLFYQMRPSERKFHARIFLPNPK